ncbi:uncharacterized protein LOC114274252 [Camellia sinensis]|uniref:uncharacterized protein LOC114274252 n=1 Tax=Camellia sinensis TaxID=4442 RepID=UPI001035DDB5|nr:uncharacterized protein LOC114274252 [Camellia sinensis]
MEAMIEIFKQVKINLSLLEAIKQVLSYAKFLKDLCTQKRKVKPHMSQKVFLTEQVSSILLHKTPSKLNDPGTPTITCTIGDHFIDRALLDLSANVNLLPYSMYEEFGLGELKLTTATLQLANRFLKVQRGMIEDVLVKVNKFYFPIDFLVLDMKPVVTLKRPIHVILGRPFSATANANINCRTRFRNMQVKLNIFSASQHPSREDDCFMIDIVDELVEGTLPFVLAEDPLEICLAHFGFEAFDIDRSIEEVNALLNFSLPFDFPP